MSEKQNPEIIIIGAGPAGLALAHHLTVKGQRPLLLEAGESAGHSWNTMPDFLALVSFWKSNYLLSEDRFKFPITSQTPAKDYVKYLCGFSDSSKLNILLSTKVKSISKEHGIFEVQTNKGSFKSRVVINATGYYSSPYTPNYLGLENTEILNLHFKDYKNPTSIKDKKKVLVVGARLSAGQILLDLQKTDVQLAISSRSPIQAMSPTPILKFFLFIVDHIEKPLQAMKDTKTPTSAPMFHDAKKMIDSGEVKLFPAIKSIHKESITFEDGTTEPFDAIVFATGFKPKFDHLAEFVELDEEMLPKLSENFESLYCENLFFIGLDHQRNIQSRFLRGIRNDAKELAVKILKRLNF